MNNNILKRVKRAYKQTKNVFSGEQKEYLWIYDNFYLIDRHYRAVLKSKHLITSVEKSDCFELIKDFCEEKNYRIEESELYAHLVKLQSTHIFTCRELYAIPILLACAALMKIGKACEQGEGLSVLPNAVNLLRFIGELDIEELFMTAWLPEKILVDYEKDYSLFTEPTKNEYRNALASYCRSHKISEPDGAKLLAERAAKEERTIGSFLFTKRKSDEALYIVLFASLFVVLFCLSFISIGFWSLLLLLPLITTSLLLTDFITSFFIRSDPAPRLKLDKVPDDAKTLVVITSLLFGADKDKRLFESLERFYLLNKDDNIFFGILGDLPDSKNQIMPGDEETMQFAREQTALLNEKYGDRFCLFLRERVENKTDGVFGGRERKRGAVTELVSFIRGNKTTGIIYTGGSFIHDIKYIFTLDADTNLSLGSVNELLGIALHPLNTPKITSGRVTEGYAIIQPIMRTELSGAFKTRFTRLISGAGGTDIYETAAFDRYQSVFGSGVFCGKGLFSVELFDRLVTPKLPDGCILSHDILEGCILRTCFVSDVSLTDTTPKNTISYTSRLHRWIRGDFQNLKFLKGELFDGLSKFKLILNVLRHLTPFFAVITALIGGLTVKNETSTLLLFVFTFLYIILPCLLTVLTILFSGKPFALRRFFSQASTAIIQSLTRAFYELCGAAHMAAVTADASVRALWRMCVSRVKMLEWVTAEESDRIDKDSLVYYISKCIVSAICGAVLFFFAPAYITKLFGLLFFLFPLIAFYESKPLDGNSSDIITVQFTDEDKNYLLSHTRDMWNYFAENVNKKSNYLPPDNIQLSPAEHTAYRTSPTNIGFYLVSALAAKDLGFINTDELVSRLEKSLTVIQALPKYGGNLYNWYDIKNLCVLGNGYVSTVDSGNFIVMLVALRQGLLEIQDEHESIPHLMEMIDEIIENHDFQILYNTKRSLFALGIDTASEKPDSICYDLFMSEARLTAYYALAKGIVPKKLWKSLGRTLTTSGGYIGMISWSGTAFEYLMPQLFLPIYRNSFTYESLCFALSEQKRARYNNMWGISESAFYSFDSDMNYQYKAHGVQKLALKRYNGDEAVLSPYSTYLSLCVLRGSAIHNLRRFEQAGMYGKYGLYEALDMTPARSSGGLAASPGQVENGVIVRNYMAHHIGMSIISCANALKSNCFVKRFMSDSSMGAAYELLQEKIPVDAHMFEDERSRFAPDIKLPLPKKYKTVTEDQMALQMPPIAFIARENLSIICTGSGHVQLRMAKYPINETSFDRYSLKQSLTVQFQSQNEVFGCAPLYREGVYSFEKGGFYASHISSSKAFSGRVKYYIHPKADTFVIETRADNKRLYNLIFCFEPMMAEIKSYFAHASFSKLFIEADYDEKDKIIYFSRRPRGEDEKQIFVAVALQDAETEFEFTTRKDGFNAWGMNSVHSIPGVNLQNETGPCINPVCIIRTREIAGGKAAMLVTLATSRKEARSNIIKARRQSKEPDTVCGVLPETERILQSVLFPSNIRNVETFTDGSINTLWMHGISGDYPIITVFMSEQNDRVALSYLMAFLVLTSSYIRFELVFLLKDEDRYYRPVERSIRTLCEQVGLNAFLNRNGGIFIKPVDSSDEFFIRFLKLSSAMFVDVFNDIGSRQIIAPIQFTEEIKTAVSEPVNEPHDSSFHVFGGCFTENGFIVDKTHPLKMPYSYILSGRSFGSIVSDSSLCYTFADNSREKRVTSFQGDPYSLSDGERFILQVGGNNYDLCAAASEVHYENGTAVFKGSVYKNPYTLTVFTCESLPLKLFRLRYEGGEKVRSALITKPVMGSGITENVCLQVKRRVTQYSACALYKNQTSADFSDGVGFTGVLGSGRVDTDFAALVFGKESGVDDVAAVSVVGTDCIYFIGACDGEDAATALIDSISREFFDGEYEKARGFARSMIPNIRFESRSRSAAILFNTFLPYQVSACRFFARASFYQSGGAYGFRDQLQDCLCLVYANPKLVSEHIIRACAHQYTEGDVQHWWHPILTNGVNRGVRSKCSDDFLWLPFVTADYVKKTGDYSVLDTEVEYITSPMLGHDAERYELPSLSGIRESVYKHCLRALSNGERFGAHGLSLMGSCDWNDAFSQVGVLGKGESIFTSFLFILTVREFLPMMKAKGDDDIAEHYKSVADKLLENIEKHAYSGEWYARAIHDDGTVIGVKGSKECEIDILPQCFAAMVKGGDKRVLTALDRAYEMLFDKKYKILKLFTPPFADGELNVGYIKGYVAGIRENGGQYTHGAVWGAIGFIVAGKKEQGLEIMNALNPAARCTDFETAKRYKIEPYAISADIYSSPLHRGRGGWSWYTGAASWYYKAMLEYVMGISLTEGFSVIDVKPITDYKTELAYNDYKLTVIASADEKAVLLDGAEITLPLKIPSGEHVLIVPVIQ
jgi:cyclic beta-1,2-glucan synthetase